MQYLFIYFKTKDKFPTTTCITVTIINEVCNEDNASIKYIQIKKYTIHYVK